MIPQVFLLVLGLTSIEWTEQIQLTIAPSDQATGSVCQLEILPAVEITTSARSCDTVHIPTSFSSQDFPLHHPIPLSPKTTKSPILSGVTEIVTVPHDQTCYCVMVYSSIFGSEESIVKGTIM